MPFPPVGARAFRSALALGLACAVVSAGVPACGARTGALTIDEDEPPRLDAGRDAGFDAAGLDAPGLDAPDALDAPFTDAGPDARDAPAPDAPDARDAPVDRGCIPLDDGCGAVEVCGDGEDDDCDGLPDDGCACEPGAVQPCFGGPPGRRGVGACADGTQLCGLSRTWGACEGGIVPSPDVCNGLDNLCDGCSQRRDCLIECPGPGDPRTPDTAPFADYPLVGRQFYPGLARSWRWRIAGGPCDELAPRLESFELTGATSENATFTPRLSGDYTVTLEVVTIEGTFLTCTWVVHVVGPGLRVEMCYPESETQDLDLFVHRPGSTTRWYPVGANANQITRDACSWANCEATLRGMGYPRADWGYAPSALVECENGPQGPQWRALGFCANPRLDIDNNLAEGIGVPENINIDAPRDGETFRVMVQNWTGMRARPVVNVYCSGRRIATYGAAPDVVPAFMGTSGDRGVGAMWRVVDVTTRLAADGTLSCEARALHRPGTTTGYYVTYDDGSY